MKPQSAVKIRANGNDVQALRAAIDAAKIMLSTRLSAVIDVKLPDSIGHFKYKVRRQSISSSQINQSENYCS